MPSLSSTPSPPTSSTRSPRSWADRPVGPVALALCALVAALSLLLPWAAGYDAWAWLVWGREITTWSLDLHGGPAWKPFPVLFTTLFGPFGGAGPDLWLFVARTGALMSLVLCFRLGRRLGGPVAGAVAVLAFVASEDWLRNAAVGNCEPILVALLLWAFERGLDGRRRSALWIGAAAALIRPEVWPFWLAFAVLECRRDPGAIRPVIGLALAIGLAWLAPPWLAHAGPWSAANHALESKAMGSDPVAGSFSRLAGSLLWPVWLLAAVGVALAWRRRDRPALGLTAGAVGWSAVVLAMTAAGFPGIARFYVPVFAVGSILAGAGVSWLAGVQRRGQSPSLPGFARPALAACIALVAALAVVPHAKHRLDLQADRADAAAALQTELRHAISAIGGREVAVACDLVYVDSSMETDLAWDLDSHIGSVAHRGRFAGVAFVAPASFSAGSPPTLPPVHTALTRAGSWRVLTADAPGRPSCARRVRTLRAQAEPERPA